jgi:ferric-dicitrate binding protein FerR (iron transport regulator)
VTTADPELDRVHSMMMAALDEECSEAERRELEALVAARPELADEWARLKRLKEVTVTLEVRQPPREIWDSYRVTVLHRTERSVAWMLIVLGIAVLGIGALWRALDAMFANWAEIPLEVRIGGSALAAGVVVLIVSIVRERLTLHRRDPYSKEIER